jgi:predicted CoA-binding protein
MGRSAAGVQDFLSKRRIAVVGVSRDRRHFSRAVFGELVRRGYDAVPVNPLGGADVDGVRFERGLRDIDPPVEAALLLTPPAITTEVVKDCAAAGIPRVWMHRGAGVGAASPAAIDFCRANGIEVVEGVCPFMYLPPAAWVHRAHRWCRERLSRRGAVAATSAALRP